MGLTTQDPYIQKEHNELYKSLSFVLIGPILNLQDTAIQKLQNLVTNAWIAGKSIHFFANFEVFEWLYLIP